jgi:hypothetical protein
MRAAEEPVMNSNEIRLEFSYSEAEYLAAARLLTLRDSDLLFRLILFFVFIMVFASILTGLLSDYPWWTGFLVSGLLLTLIYYNALVQQTRRYFRGDPKFRDQYQFTFSEQGIAAKTSQLDAKLSWSLYTKYLENSRMYVLVYGEDLRMMTVVPKRAFQNSLQENSFRELLSRHVGNHSAAPRLEGIAEPVDEYKPTSLNPPDWR